MSSRLFCHSLSAVASLALVGLLNLATPISVKAEGLPTKSPASEISPTASSGLGEASVANQVLRVVLHSPAQLSLFNARGQLLYRAEGRKGLEIVPLKSVDFGFLYLTLRQGQVEQSFRLLYNGK